MKETNVDELTRDLSGFLDAAQRDRVLIMRQGKPVALLIGIEDKEEEDWELETSPAFWRMIEERRREVGVRLEDVERHLFEDEAK